MNASQGSDADISGHTLCEERGTPTQAVVDLLQRKLADAEEAVSASLKMCEEAKTIADEARRAAAASLEDANAAREAALRAELVAEEAEKEAAMAIRRSEDAETALAESLDREANVRSRLEAKQKEMAAAAILEEQRRAELAVAAAQHVSIQAPHMEEIEEVSENIFASGSTLARYRQSSLDSFLTRERHSEGHSTSPLQVTGLPYPVVEDPNTDYSVHCFVTGRNGGVRLQRDGFFRRQMSLCVDSSNPLIHYSATRLRQWGIMEAMHPSALLISRPPSTGVGEPSVRAMQMDTTGALLAVANRFWLSIYDVDDILFTLRQVSPESISPEDNPSKGSIPLSIDLSRIQPSLTLPQTREPSAICWRQQERDHLVVSARFSNVVSIYNLASVRPATPLANFNATSNITSLCVGLLRTTSKSAPSGDKQSGANRGNGQSTGGLFKAVLQRRVPMSKNISKLSVDVTVAKRQVVFHSTDTVPAIVAAETAAATAETEDAGRELCELLLAGGESGEITCWRLTMMRDNNTQSLTPWWVTRPSPLFSSPIVGVIIHRERWVVAVTVEGSIGVWDIGIPLSSTSFGATRAEPHSVVQTSVATQLLISSSARRGVCGLHSMSDESVATSFERIHMPNPPHTSTLSEAAVWETNCHSLVVSLILEDSSVHVIDIFQKRVICSSFPKSAPIIPDSEADISTTSTSTNLVTPSFCLPKWLQKDGITAVVAGPEGGQTLYTASTTGECFSTSNGRRMIGYGSSSDGQPLRWSVSSLLTKSEGFTYKLPACVVDAEPGAREIIVSADLSAYLGSRERAAHSPQHCSEIRFTWTNSSSGRPSLYGGDIYFNQEVGISEVRPFSIKLSSPYNGPAVRSRVPRVDLETKLCLASARESADVRNFVSKIHSAAVKISYHRRLRPVISLNDLSSPVTCLFAHPSQPVLFAGLSNGHVSVLGSGLRRYQCVYPDSPLPDSPLPDSTSVIPSLNSNDETVVLTENVGQDSASPEEPPVNTRVQTYSLFQHGSQKRISSNTHNTSSTSQPKSSNRRSTVAPSVTVQERTVSVPVTKSLRELFASRKRPQPDA